MARKRANGEGNIRKRKDGRGAGTSEISRLTAYIRNVGITERRRRENGIGYARSLRRWIYPSHLHPRHTPDAGKRRRKEGQFHGAGHVNKQQITQRVGENDTIILSAAL